MDGTELRILLQELKDGGIEVDDAVERLRHLPFEEVGCATIDHHRALRQGFPEVIFGQGKTVGQMETIIAAMLAKGSNILATRVDGEKAFKIKEGFPAACYHAEARCLRRRFPRRSRSAA